MTFACALLLLALSAGTEAGHLRGPARAAVADAAPIAAHEDIAGRAPITRAAARPIIDCPQIAHAPIAAAAPLQQGPGQAASGVIIDAGIDGRLAIYDAAHERVVELDKPGGRPLQIALAPGAYEAWLVGHNSRRARFQVGDGPPLLLTLASFAEPDDHAPAAPDEWDDHLQPSPPSHPRDGRHRIEIRMGGWTDSWYDGYADMWDTGSMHGAFGLEYLHLVLPDLAVGIGLSGLVRVADGGPGWDDGGSAQATLGIPIVARWYPVRRMTRFRSVEPYALAGIGPVFGVDAFDSDHQGPWNPWGGNGGDFSSTHVGTTIGGRLGGGVDFRLGSVFTIGMAAAWNWDAFSHPLWRGTRPGGGEFDVVLGWAFGS